MWLRLPKPPEPEPAGQLQAAQETSPEEFERMTRTLYRMLFMEAFIRTKIGKIIVPCHIIFFMNPS